jgi:hypothetical protein
MKGYVGNIGIDLQSRFLGMFDCINVLIWGGVKLTKNFIYIQNWIASVIVSAAAVVYSHFQSRTLSLRCERSCINM